MLIGFSIAKRLIFTVMSLLSSPMMRLFFLVTFFMVLIGGFAWYTATVKYRRDTAHLQFVDPANPLWATAKARAKATIDTLYAYYPQYPNASFAKFSNDGPSGFREDIWAPIIALGPGFVKVKIDPKYLTDQQKNPERELPTGQLLDWMIQLPNNSIRGGFTTQALLTLQLEQKKAASAADSLRADLALFQDTL